MIFELMKEDDIDDVVSIENKVFKDPWPRHFFIDDLKNKGTSKYYVLKLDDKIVAYAGIWLMFENCDLVNIAVDSSYQGMGYGEKMLRFIICESIKCGCEFMHLEVRPSNLAALELYKKYGFIKTRERKAYYDDGEDCIDMVKGLLGLNEKDFSN